MNDHIRLELTGRRAEAWNRVFDSLTNVVERAIDQLAPSADEATRQKAKDLTQDLAMVTGGFIKAKLESPVLDNELKIAEIATKFEELKLTKAKREQIEVETDIRKVQLDKDRLELWERRMAVAIKWLGFLQDHIIPDGDGRVVLLLTNQDMRALTSELKALPDDDRPSKPTPSQ